ncbi:MFS transporter [Microbacterium sp. 18062]|uniref:MFS transporter n=1 Tax=Microbacterium sp. 18062 TaxID=2681410 RepID=UPI00135BF229|nr:MFS transporter [Microbacterium sp. 18062]
MIPTHTSRTRLGRGVFLLAAVNLVALGSLTAPVVAGIPVKVVAAVPIEQRASALATVLALGGLTALVANPVFGALSDRTRGPLGRRRPWMLGGVLAGLGGMVLLTTAESILSIAVSWIVVQTAYNATFASAAALLADSVPEPRRAAASGVFTAAAFLGALPPLALATLLPAHVGAISFVMPVAALVVVGLAMTLPDSPAVRSVPRRSGEKPRVRLPVAFVAVWLQRLAMQSAFSLTTAFTLYLIVDRMASDPTAATPIATVNTLLGGAGVVIGATVAGAWASRRGGYLPFLVCAALGLAAAAGLRSIVAAPIALWTAAVIGGLAVGTYLTVNFALAMRTVPEGRFGAYLGILNGSETLPQVFAPVAAAALLTVGAGDPVSGSPDNYAALSLGACLVALLSIGVIPALRRAATPTERETADAKALPFGP